jgi:hypothetical protein
MVSLSKAPPSFLHFHQQFFGTKKIIKKFIKISFFENLGRSGSAAESKKTNQEGSRVCSPLRNF